MSFAQKLFIKRPDTKPLLRGYSHQAAFFYAAGAGSMLLVNTSTTAEIVSVLVYSICLCLLFAISALYHIPNWQPHVRVWLRRLDHCSIYLLIAGTYTPVCLLVIPSKSSFVLLIITWIIATLGILQSLLWISAPKWVSSILYLGAGWNIAFFWQEVKAAMTLSQLSLLVAGGVAYSLGAIAYASKRPRLAPKIFGYHEIFHLLVITAAVLHFIAITQIILSQA